jgi:hypothetical protein
MIALALLWLLKVPSNHVFRRESANGFGADYQVMAWAELLQEAAVGHEPLVGVSQRRVLD